MSSTPREIVQAALRFESPTRLPRDLWALPWAEEHLPGCLAELRRRWPADLDWSPRVYPPSARVSGDQYAVGTYVDEWGCAFENLQRGVIGEVRAPILADLADWRQVRPPYECLPEQVAQARDVVNRRCAASDRFILPPHFSRPWERYQFLRGTENAMMDLAEGAVEARALLAEIHAYYLRELEFWVHTDVDAIYFMDDWGSQNALLIEPGMWRDWFKPLYRDYCSLAHAHGKFAFMHSDGNIASIYEDLIEVGVDALNSQLFCMDMGDLERRAKGRITFWGEIDRQHVLPSPDSEVGRQAVRQVARHLCDPRGGLIAQFELSPGSDPVTAIAICEEWDRVEAEQRDGTGASRGEGIRSEGSGEVHEH
jgi:uroporphyrinogen decarboxylase